MADNVVEICILAFTRGSAYALIVVGFALVLGVGRILNLFHGVFYLLGAYVVHLAGRQLGVDAGLWEMALASVAAAAAVGAIGYAYYFAVVRHFADQQIRLMVVGLASSLLVAQTLEITVGTRGAAVKPIVAGMVSVAGVHLPAQELVVAGAALTSFFLLWLLLKGTRLGAALRATAQDARGARIVGIEPTTVVGVTVVVSAFLAGLAGALTAPLRVVGPGLWSFALVKSFTAVIVGGLGSLRGALLAAYVLGAVEVVTTYAAGEAKADVAAMALAVLILMLRPRGLLHESAGR